ncbi:hypothetical protein ACVIWU_006751 [Bradyrhizobium sp. USDA 4509]
MTNAIYVFESDWRPPLAHLKSNPRGVSSKDALPSFGGLEGKGESYRDVNSAASCLQDRVVIPEGLAGNGRLNFHASAGRSLRWLWRRGWLHIAFRDGQNEF